ncbi:MAG: DUF885 domain-containing protein [Proteobacteria bacterium]|nr:DUF885 domain-containing protein [Pseudomonadota bacterium]
MEDHQSDRRPRSKDKLNAVAKEVFDYLGKTFPVCCWSDEFHYFPQIIPPQGVWTGWDNFRPENIAEVTARLSSAEHDIGLISQETEDFDIVVDAETLKRMVRTLREQLVEVRFHETQPTFHLTVMCTALAASLGDSDRRAWSIRAQTLPSFLKQAQEVLIDMPRLFRDLGLEMICDIAAWLRSLEMEQNELAPVFSAIERFADFLRSARTRSDYLLPPEIVERIVKEHLGCGVGLDDVRNTLMEEIDEMGRIMEEAGEALFPGTGWREAIRKIPLPAFSAGGQLEMYRKEADNLLRHCIARGIVPEDLPGTSPLRISILPPYLKAIRAASAYSFTPANPSQKGTFYIVPPEGPWSDNREELAEYRMLTAHETYPGHHLLDTWRWHFISPSRRRVESPLFYEGWACFSEELMRMTGYFSIPADLLLLAKRRYRRAVRGLVDLDLQTGTLERRSAAKLLVEAGFPADAAASVVPKYALRPGYQVCYTFGLRRFADLYFRYGTNDTKRFVQEVLSGGEIGFDLLEKCREIGGQRPYFTAEK